MEEQNLNEAPQEVLHKTNFMCDIYWWIYIVSKSAFKNKNYEQRF